jgi:hypothetical protein
MREVAMPNDPISRRRFLEVAGAAGAATVASVAGTGTADAATTALSEAQRDMLLRVARAGAVFPVPFPQWGERGPALSRASGARLLTATRRMHPKRMASARSGVRYLVKAGCGHMTQAQLINHLGAVAAKGNTPTHRDLQASTALAIATVSRHFDPNDDAAARIWLAGLANLHRRGKLLALAKAATR